MKSKPTIRFPLYTFPIPRLPLATKIREYPLFLKQKSQGGIRQSQLDEIYSLKLDTNVQFVSQMPH